MPILISSDVLCVCWVFWEIVYLLNLQGNTNWLNYLGLRVCKEHATASCTHTLKSICVFVCVGSARVGIALPGYTPGPSLCSSLVLWAWCVSLCGWIGKGGLFMRPEEDTVFSALSIIICLTCSQVFNWAWTEVAVSKPWWSSFFFFNLPQHWG